jgi:hypothetical protein
MSNLIAVFAKDHGKDGGRVLIEEKTFDSERHVLWDEHEKKSASPNKEQEQKKEKKANKKVDKLDLLEGIE